MNIFTAMFGEIMSFFKKIFGKNTDPVTKPESTKPTPPKKEIVVPSTSIKKDNKTIILDEAKSKGINDKKELAMLLAQLDHESLGFKKLEENLNYKADTLVRVFPWYVKGLDDARNLVSMGKQAIANRIYGGRMGNTNPNDGWTYRGRGFIQLTGKNNYTEYQRLTGLPIVTSPDILFDPSSAAVVSVSYWMNTSGLRAAAQAGDVTRVSAIINTGNPNTSPRNINGLADRKNKYTKYLKEV